MQNVYVIKTGKQYKFIKKLNDNEIIAINIETNDTVILNINDIITDKEINNFKNIFRILCKNGDITITNEKYTVFGETKWDNDGIGCTPCTTYLETLITLDNEKLLNTKCNMSK